MKPLNAPSLKKPEPRHWIRLTRACNQKCLFCHDRGAQDGSSLPFDAVQSELERGKHRGIRRVVLSGGEPTMHPRFLDIVGLAKTLGYTHTQVVTNGRRFCYPDFLDRSLKAGVREITFSLHGHTPALHDALTQVPGSFVQAVTGLKNALARDNLIVSMDVVINQMNLPHLREFLEYFVMMGVMEFDLLWLVPFGDAWKNRETLFCDMEKGENLDHLHRALELSRDSRLHIWTNRLPAHYLQGFEHLIQSPEKLYDEVGGREEMFGDFLENEVPMDCHGERCSLCFVRDFCADLSVLRRRGVLRAKVLAPCYRGQRPAGRPTVFRSGKKISLESFIRFYIDRRYFLKSRVCRKCEWNGMCAGLPVGYVRQCGFPERMPSGGVRAGPKVRPGVFHV